MFDTGWIPGTRWSKEEKSRNMSYYRHDLWPSKPCYDYHITVVFRDNYGTVPSCPVDHHSTFYHRQNGQNGKSKWHYGWIFGKWCDENESPEYEKMKIGCKPIWAKIFTTDCLGQNSPRNNNFGEKTIIL